MLDYEITAEETQAKLKSGETLTLLDCREPWEYDVAHIEGSKHIPMGDIPARANNELDPEQHIIVVCHHGVRSMNVTAWLRQQGFEMAQSMRGGIDHWSRAIDPKVPIY
ncbi:MAG: Rhodanese domain protein [Acidobacteriaceae bacterium]|jgi:rhodanese-related sulfurtransferase|nr:Rhodanese domain protein [Acidobacteriaceae bacterium]